jgi:polysaccharide chain length determinant protein (PEP-CTERM system associated)
MSRTQLEAMVQELNLYPRERQSMIMEDVIDLMRNDIRIGSPLGSRREGGAFSVSYVSGDPRLTVAVSERLASILIRENLADRSVFADQTDQFLQSQLDDARRKLKDQEAQLEAFRRANPGRMPQELQSNQQALLDAQTQLRAVQESVNRDRDQQLMMQRLLADARSLTTLSPAPLPQGNNPGQEASLTTEQQLERAKEALRVLETRLKSNHPDIAIQKRVIRDLERKVAAESLQQPVTPAATASTPAEAARLARISELEAQLDSLSRRIDAKQKDEKQLLAVIDGYRQRIASVPTVETQLTALMRDYQSQQEQYQQLLSKSQDASMAANLERRNIGEQFKIIDNARLPQRPFSPNRPVIMLAGAAAGLGLGLALAALLEYRDSTLRSEDDVIVALALPVIAFVPTMTTRQDRSNRKKKRLILLGSGACAVLLCAGVLTWKFETLVNWIQ